MICPVGRRKNIATECPNLLETEVNSDCGISDYNEMKKLFCLVDRRKYLVKDVFFMLTII